MSKKLTTLLVAGLSVALCTTGCSRSSSHATSAAPLTVDTSTGRLQGLSTGTAREFLGVRYAEAPTGSRRWTMPVPAPKAADTLSATKPGPNCAQVGAAPGASSTASTIEDCLFLNVTTPRQVDAGAKLPVMVWWHGGGYISGSGAAYDAQRLASQGNVIVVTVNMRLGVFGYLGLPGLAGSGDFGLADEILATKWAKTNAAAFGGDPGNITVFGQSSGAMSACALLTSPAASGLVNKVAIASGGACQLKWPSGGLLPGTPAQTPYVDLATSQSFGLTEAKSLGCTGTAVLACLRALPVKKLLTVFPLFANVLAYGTPLLPEDPAAAVRSGQVANVPVLSGGTENEERAFVGGVQQAAPKTYTAATYPLLLKAAFGAKAAAVASRYPLSDYPSAAVAFATLITDASWACPTLTGNAALAGHGNPIYGYEFADPDPPNVNGVTIKDVPQGAAHATDLPYLFDLNGKSLLRTDAQQSLATSMIEYWSSFARTGVPTAKSEPAWPKLGGAAGPTLQLGRNIKTVDLAAEHQCSFSTGLG